MASIKPQQITKRSAGERLSAGIRRDATANQIAILLSEAIAEAMGRPELILTASDLDKEKRRQDDQP